MKIMTLCAVAILLFATATYAWNDEETHPTISEFAAKEFFGPESINEYINGRRVKEWIRQGSILEDTGNIWQFLGGTARSLNHFHNASKATLAEARLTDVPFFMPIGGSPTWESTLLWAQDGDYQKTRVNGDWSWSMVRYKYHKYLTTSDGALREQWQSDYLKGLGYQMHLIQDMGQPNHVRNDTHIWDGASLVMGLETWARRNDGDIKEMLNTTTLPTVTVDLKAPFIADTTKAPVANLFDTRGYLGTRPPSAAFNQGLAEYTNANFFSENTIFASEYDTDDKHYQPYPRKDETNIQDFINEQMALTTISNDEDFGLFDTFVVKKQATNGEPLNCLATSGPFSRKLYQERGEDKYFYRSFMYDACFHEYAEKLIPASVVYSKALLDYFFRGKIDVQPVLDAVTFRTITVTAQNTTANGEEMPAGEVSLVIRYKELLESGTGPLRTLNFPTDEYKYRVVTLPGLIKIPTASDPAPTVQLTFDLSADPLPLHIADVTLQVVYKGKLGNEEGSVAVGSKTLDALGTDIALSLPSSGIYAKTTGGTFDSLAFTAVTNIPGGLSLEDGVIELVLEYQVATTDPFISLPVDSEPLDAESYIIRLAEKNGVKTLPQGVPVELQFDLSTAPLPLWATDVYLNIVYRRSGDPETKTLAVGYHDISEPTPVDIFNNTDYVCISNQWYPAGTPEARTAADLAGNQNGIDDDIDTFMHNIANIYTKITSTTTPVTVSTTNFDLNESGPVAPATLKRLGFVLADYTLTYSSLRDLVHIDPLDGWSGGSGILATLENGTAVKNQTDADGIYRYSSMYNMRGKLMWGGAGTVYGNLKLPADAVCDWGLLPNVQ